MIKKNYSKYTKWLLVTCLGFFLFFSCMFLVCTNGLHCGNIEPSIWGDYGSLVGGLLGPLLTLASILFILDNIENQKDSLEQQRESVKQQERLLQQEKINFVKSQVESRFFELINFHKQNVNEIKSNNKQSVDVFETLHNEFHYTFNRIKPCSNISGNINSLERDYINIQIAYLFFFYGFTNDDRCKNNYSYWFERINKYKRANITFDFSKIGCTLSAHQSILSHYYRHLFQSVKFINEQPSKYFNYEEKYNFVKTLRAQLSNHEQALLLYNSISPLGDAWELDINISDPNRKMITKYNMIKNLPPGFTREIDPKCFYPDVYFEFDDKPTDRRTKLEILYREIS